MAGWRRRFASQGEPACGAGRHAAENGRAFLSAMLLIRVTPTPLPVRMKLGHE